MSEETLTHRVETIERKTAALGIAVALLLLSACTGHPAKGQWVLKEYDKDKGYTFVHDGVVYQTNCFATGRPMLADKKPDLDPGSFPPQPVYAQSACDDVLRYLGKPVPNLTQPEPLLLLFVGEDNWRLAFTIENAK